MPATESTSSRPLKRKRISNGTAHPSKASDGPPTRSGTLWFDDGNVVLHVENTLFRVHRTFLAVNSGIFDDMFKIPQPPEDNDLIEGAPVVRMHDKLQDWENMLTTIYFPMRIHPTDKNLAPGYLISMLRLGKKYQFDRIFIEALARLQLEFPRFLHAYDKIFNVGHPALAIKCKTAGTPQGCRYMACSTWSLFDLTNVMIELGIESTLPLALYLCSIRSGEIIWNGCPRPDQTTAKLSAKAQSIIFSHRDELQGGRITLPFIYSNSHSLPSEDCEDLRTCTRGLINETKTLETEILMGIRHALSLSEDDELLSLCDDCQNEARELYDGQRLLLWNRLPRIFNLPEWEDAHD